MPRLHFTRIGDHIEIYPQGFKVFFAAADFVGFGCAEFEELILFHAFGFADHVDGIVIVFDDCPVGDVFADWSFDKEFVGEF